MCKISMIQPVDTRTLQTTTMMSMMTTLIHDGQFMIALGLWHLCQCAKIKNPILPKGRPER